MRGRWSVRDISLRSNVTAPGRGPIVPVTVIRNATAPLTRPSVAAKMSCGSSSDMPRTSSEGSVGGAS